MPANTLITHARALKDALVAVRRDIHRYPELAFQEQRTAAKGRDWLRGLGLEVQEGIAGTYGLVATLPTDRPGPAMLISADMDALRITEETGTEYVSEVAGVMHACGHDAHVSCLLGAASLLIERHEALRGRLKFLLQPAEE